MNQGIPVPAPSQNDADECFVDPILPTNPANSQGSDSSALSDLSSKDKPWDKHRGNADRVQHHYWNSAEFKAYAQRVSECAQLLEFNPTAPDENGERKLKLSSARFCRVRHCPVCQWRRSLMWKAKAYKVLPKIVEKYPKHRWLFMTLTVRNCRITELRDTLQHMNKSFRKMTRRKTWPATGWLRSVEVTRGRDGSAHPHFHCLLMVKSSYFTHGYIKQAEWVETWRSCLKVDYNPVMNIQAIRKKSQPMQLVPELLKYCTKESDLVADQGWFLELTRQMHKLQCIATGGVLKQYLRELEQEPDDLIGESDEPEQADEDFSLYFGWRRSEKRYRLNG